jgi:hypothetical protein
MSFGIKLKLNAGKIFVQYIWDLTASVNFKCVFTFKGPMTTLVITESNGEWPYVDYSNHETAHPVRWTVGCPMFTNSILAIDRGFLKPSQTLPFQKSS